MLWKSFVAITSLCTLTFIGLLIYNLLPSNEKRSGKEIFMTFCKSCHLHGTTGAPPLGNKEIWSKRRGKGIEVLTTHAIEGFRGMPPRGTCLNCTDIEIKSAIEYMINNSS